MIAEDTDRMQQKIAEIAGVQCAQALLIGLIKLAATTVAERARIAFGNIGRSESLVLPAIDHVGEGAGGPALVIKPFSLNELLDKPDHVVGVEDREIRCQICKLRMATQKLDTDRVERAEPRHAFDCASDQMTDTLLHFARGLVRESHGENLAWIGKPGRQNMCDAGRQNTCLACARPGKYQNRTFSCQDSLTLFRVQPFQVIGFATLLVACCHGTCSNATGSRRAACRSVVIAEKRHIVGKVRHLTRM